MSLSENIQLSLLIKAIQFIIVQNLLKSEKYVYSHTTLNVPDLV